MLGLISLFDVNLEMAPKATTNTDSEDTFDRISSVVG
jgi:hypothetical protein